MPTDMSKVTAKPSSKRSAKPKDIVPPDGREKSDAEVKAEEASAKVTKAMQDKIAALNDPKRGQGRKPSEAAKDAAKKEPDPKRAEAKSRLSKQHDKAVKWMERQAGPVHQRLVSLAVGIGKKGRDGLAVETDAEVKEREALYRHMSSDSAFVRIESGPGGVFDLSARNEKGVEKPAVTQYWTSPAQLKAIQAAKEKEAADKRAAEKKAREDAKKAKDESKETPAEAPAETQQPVAA